MPADAARDLALLLRVRWQSARNVARFADKTTKRVGVFLFAGAVVLFGVILLAFALLLETVKAQNPASAATLMERTHFWVFLFLLAGGVPFVSGVLFSPSDEISLLSVSPVRPFAAVLVRLGDAVAAASAQFVVLGVPLLAACAFALRLPFWAWLPFVLLVAAEVALPSLMVAALLLLCARVVGVRRVKGAVALTSALLAVVLCLVTVREFSQQAGRGISLAAALASQSPPAPAADYLPPSWAAHALSALGARRPLDAALPFAQIWGATLALIAACLWWGQSVLRGDNGFSSGDGGDTSSAAARALSPLAALWVRLSIAPPVRAFLQKDARQLLRDLVLLSQIGIPLILYFVPFVIGGQLGKNQSSDLLLLCLGVVGTIAYMETSILGLSSIGLEGRGFWLVLSAPVSPGLFLQAKWTGAFVLSALLCVPLWGFACAFYHADALLTGAGLGILLVAVAALCGLGVGISGIFPRFTYENPAHRASVSALIWGFVLASGYVLLGGAFLGLGWFGAAQWPEMRTVFLGGGAGLFACLSLAVGLIPLFAARRRLTGFAWEAS